MLLVPICRFDVVGSIRLLRLVWFKCVALIRLLRYCFAAVGSWVLTCGCTLLVAFGWLSFVVLFGQCCWLCFVVLLCVGLAWLRRFFALFWLGVSVSLAPFRGLCGCTLLVACCRSSVV